MHIVALLQGQPISADLMPHLIPFPGRGAAFFMPLRRSTVLVVKRVDRLQACGIVLDSQGGFAPPSAVAFGQP
jgi:hypothetical protein